MVPIRVDHRPSMYSYIHFAPFKTLMIPNVSNYSIHVVSRDG